MKRSQKLIHTKLTGTNTFLEDWDSNLSSHEMLDDLVEMALEHNPRKQEKLQLLKEALNNGLKRGSSFAESLRIRIALAPIHKRHIEKHTQYAWYMIHPDTRAWIDMLVQKNQKIFIISGGFEEVIIPVAKTLGISAERVFANRFIYDDEGYVIGFDEHNLASQGKIELVKSIQSQFQGTTFISGDGAKEWEVWDQGLIDFHILNTSYREQEELLSISENIVTTPQEMRKLKEELLNSKFLIPTT